MENFIHPASAVEVAFHDVKNVFMALSRYAMGQGSNMNSAYTIKTIAEMRVRLDAMEKVCLADIETRKADEKQAAIESRKYQKYLEGYLAKYPHQRARAERLGSIKITDASVFAPSPIAQAPETVTMELRLPQRKTMFGFGFKRQAA